jgi:hypothetical protein
MFRTQKFPPAPPVREEVVQQHIMNALRGAGNIVLSTVNRIKLCHCPHCGHAFRPSGANGASPGVPDVLARPGERASTRWPRAVWLGIECKGAKTRLSPQQKEFHEQGAIVIARSVDEALDAMEETSEELEAK